MRINPCIPAHFQVLAAQGRSMRALLEDARRLCQPEDADSCGAREWRNFVAHCSNAVQAGLAGMVSSSLDFLITSLKV
eukprot:4193080-Pyramimonas_sp.AAC.1